ncbi:MAG: type IV pilus modification PilV family protein [Candidatus Xenobia bacterium]
MMHRGYTLVEVMIAAILVAITIFAVFSLYAACTTSLRMSHDLANASSLAEQEIETAVATPFDELSAPSQTTRHPIVDGVRYQVDITINGMQEFADGQGKPLVDEVRVTVSWIGGAMHGQTSVTWVRCVYDFTNTQ